MLECFSPFTFQAFALLLHYQVLSWSIRSKSKTNHDSLMHIFPCYTWATCICFQFCFHTKISVTFVIGQCHFFHWFWFYTQLKTPLSSLIQQKQNFRVPFFVSDIWPESFKYYPFFIRISKTKSLAAFSWRAGSRNECICPFYVLGLLRTWTMMKITLCWTRKY